jgi:hypothetical protein
MTTYLLPRDYDFSFPDFESIRSRLTNAISTVMSYWTDFARAAIENILLDAVCFNFDVLMGYQAQRIRETRLATVRYRPTAVRLARVHCNYRPDENAVASTMVTLSIPTAATADVQIATGSVIYTSGPNRVSGQLRPAATITAGNTEVDGTWEHSETILDQFTASGTPRERFPLSGAPYVWGSARMTDAAGSWTEVERLADYGPTDRVFVVYCDSDGYAEVEIGNGTYGSLASGTVDIEYEVGGGDEGNVAAGSLTKIQGTFTDLLGNPVSVSVMNAEKATGGLDKESVELIRFKAPAAAKAQERSIGRDDMESNVERLSSVALSLVLTVNQRAGIPENTGHVFMVGFGTTTASGRYRPSAATSSMKAAAVTQLEDTYPVPETFDVVTMDTVFNEVSFEVTIQVQTGYTFTEAATNVYNALDDLFAVTLSDAEGRMPNTDVGFGESLDGVLQWQRLFNTASQAVGVADMDEDSFIPPNDVALEAYEFPKLGTVRVTDADSGSYLEF